MTVCYHKLKQLVSTIAAAVLRVYALLEHKASGTNCVALDWMNAFLFLSGKIDSLNSLEQSKIFIILSNVMLIL